jgi:hypothetical protein
VHVQQGQAQHVQQDDLFAKLIAAYVQLLKCIGHYPGAVGDGAYDVVDVAIISIVLIHQQEILDVVVYALLLHQIEYPTFIHYIVASICSSPIALIATSRLSLGLLFGTAGRKVIRMGLCLRVQVVLMLVVLF